MPQIRCQQTSEARVTIARLVERLLADETANATITSAEAGAERRLTGAELGRALNATSRALIEKFAARKGDRVVLRAGNSVEHAIVSLAAMAAGLVVVPVSPTIDARDLDWIMTNCRPKGYVRDPDSAPLDVDGVAGMDFESLLSTADGVEPAEPRWAVGGEDIATIIHTSGSTGRAKGVCLTHRALTANAEALTRHLDLTPNDVHLCVLPLHHSNALHFSLITALLNDATTVIARGFPVRGAGALVRRHGVTHISAAPQAIKLILRDPEFRAEQLPTLTTVVTASAPLSQTLCDTFVTQTGIKLVQGYGLTECTNFATMTPPDLSRDDYRVVMFSQDVASVGVALPGTEVTIARPTTTDESGNEVGEVVIRGPQLSPGYWQDEQFDGVLRTGDLGYLREIAGRPFLFLVGRIKEIIIRNGENHSPRQIDDDLAAAIGDLDYAAVGVADESVGEEIALCLHADLALRERVTTALAAVPLVRRPRLLVWLTKPIPRTATGKVGRAELRTICTKSRVDGAGVIAEVTDLRDRATQGGRHSHH
jgi:long-chain acyl-CoA synthetase